jgi:hypothetical protein
MATFPFEPCFRVSFTRSLRYFNGLNALSISSWGKTHVDATHSWPLLADRFKSIQYASAGNSQRLTTV